ncbi:F-box protein [Cupriavidus respiraculi]|uniref:F-box domain-containing protein n=1 Tax=Cupriavidus respiraculi TaxID=195930 RepID=A0ABM8WNW6_9BURK|nr:F-box protein [Cupriavidus respiraculi]CAG9169124.1 hypothetical protein LMG21510_01342 [Cupriavidus respiraculi]
MPQDCIAGIELTVFRTEGTNRAEQDDGNNGRLTTSGSSAVVQKRTAGPMLAAIRSLVSTNSDPQKHPLTNQDWARLPVSVTSKIFTYLADPFDRATLAMTCRVLDQRLKPYRKEFALFRHVIAAKRRLDTRTQSSCIRELSVWLDIFSSNGWSQWRTCSALRTIFARLGALYPHVPERVFHEIWPLFLGLDSKPATQLLQQIADAALKQSPKFAIVVLTEIARRTVHSPSMKPDFHDKLLDLAIPLWQHPNTEEAEHLIGAIAQRMEIRKDNETNKRRDEARWKRMVALLPSTTNVNSPAVLGLALSALEIQFHWERHGKQQGIGFPAVAILRERIGAFPSHADIGSNAIRYRTRKEEEIDNRRARRYIASGRFARDCAEDEAARRQFAGHFSSSMPRIQTAGGGCG